MQPLLFLKIQNVANALAGERPRTKRPILHSTLVWVARALYSIQSCRTRTYVGIRHSDFVREYSAGSSRGFWSPSLPRERAQLRGALLGPASRSRASGLSYMSHDRERKVVWRLQIHLVRICSRVDLETDDVVASAAGVYAAPGAVLTFGH
jgi:hypothetical protein